MRNLAIQNNCIFTFFSIFVIGENVDEVSLKALQSNIQCVGDKLQHKVRLIAFLKHNLDAERSEADRLHEKITTVLANGDSNSKLSKKSKKSFTNFKRKKSGNEPTKYRDTGSVNDKQFSVVIQLVLAKQELANEIKESLEMESRLTTLGKHGEEYTALLFNKCSDNGVKSHKSDPEVVALLRERKRLENEFVFNEAQEGLLEKQIILLKKQRKFSVKALRKYEDEFDQCADQSSIVQALVAILMTSSCHAMTSSISNTMTSTRCDNVMMSSGSDTMTSPRHALMTSSTSDTTTSSNCEDAKLDVLGEDDNMD